MMAMEKPRVTYDEFIHSLQIDNDEATDDSSESNQTNLALYNLLGRNPTREDIESDSVVSSTCTFLHSMA